MIPLILMKPAACALPADIADQITGAGKVRGVGSAAVINSIHVVSTDDIIGNRAGRYRR